MPPHLSRITIYPVKSLDGIDLTEAMVLPPAGPGERPPICHG